MPTIAGRPVSSARRPATSPTMPTGHGPTASSAARSGPPAVRMPVSTGAGLIEPRLLAGSLARIGHAERGPGLGDGRAHEVAASAVGLLEHGGQRGRLVDGRGEQQPGGVERLPHPPGGVEPGGEDEADRLQVHAVRAHACLRQEGGDPGPRRGPHALEAELRDRPVLAEDRHHVRDGPDGGEVRQVARLGLRAGDLAQEQARDRERDARSRQPSIGIDVVVALRVDEGDRRGQDLGQVVVVGDDDVDPARRRRGDLRDARGPGVDRHDQRDAVPRRGLDRRERQAVPLLQAAGDVRDGVQAEPPEGEHELGEAGQAIGIEVAEHHDPLAALDGAPGARDQAVGVGQQPRVVQPVGGGTEEPGHRGRIGDAASREDRGRERPETELASRRPNPGIEVEGLREHPAVTRVDHRREDATSALRRACPDGGTVAGAGLAGSPADRIGSRPRPGPTITWRVGGLGEPRARRRAAGRPADATRRAAGRR